MSLPRLTQRENVPYDNLQWYLRIIKLTIVD